MNRDEQLKVAKRIITVMLCILFGCYTAFILGARWFAIILTNELQLIDNFIITHNWAWFIQLSIFLAPQVLLFTMAVCGKYKLNWWHYLSIISACISIAAFRAFLLIPNMPVMLNLARIENLLTGLLLFVILPITINSYSYKRKLENSSLISGLGYLIFLGYWDLSNTIKSIAGYSLGTTPMTSLIVLIDVMIALTIAVIISIIIHKGGINMGWPISWGAGSKESAEKAKADKAAKKQAKKDAKKTKGK